jgi:phosphate transport system ATP-binding protein
MELAKTEPILTVRNLNAYFGDVHAVKDVNLDVVTHQVTALIGPSGCGKSTFLRCLNRMHEEVPGARVSGEIKLENRVIYGMGVDPVRIRRRIGMVFQKPNPFPAMSIYDNVVAGLRLAGVTKKSVLDETVEDSLKKAALWEEVKDKLKKSGMSLSGGQQQRLCIARTLAVKPSIMLMDEPTSALDPISTNKIEELVVDLAQSVTIIIVTHNLQQASRISDQTAFFLLGEMIEMSSTSKIFTTPQDERTEQYVTGRFG